MQPLADVVGRGDRAGAVRLVRLTGLETVGVMSQAGHRVQTLPTQHEADVDKQQPRGEVPTCV